MQIRPDQLAVVTGGGTGIGRALCRAAQRPGRARRYLRFDRGQHGRNARTLRARGTVRHARHDLSCRRQRRGADAGVSRHSAGRARPESIDLLINNAGIGAGGGFVAGDRAEWERTFAICWYGVYYGARTFMPLLVESAEGHIVNISSVNGFWASLGPGVPHTAYWAAKFAVKGFTEALISDLRRTRRTSDARL